MLKPLADHILCVPLDREALDAILTSRASTARDVNEAPRIVTVDLAPDTTKPRYALVLKVGPGRLHPKSGLMQTSPVQPGDIAIMPGSAPYLEVPYTAREISGMQVHDRIAKTKVHSCCWDSCEATIEAP